MKKITILLSIFLILNISTTTSDPLEDLLGGLLGGILDEILGILKKLLDFLRNLLGSSLSEEELRDLAEKLRQLSKLGYTISSEELLKRAKIIAEINILTGGEWTAKFNLESLYPFEAELKLYGVLDTEVDEPSDDETPREKRQAGRSKRAAASCTYNIEFDVRNKWPDCRPIISYVQDQGQCGSCWAVATASCYTDRYCIERAKRRWSTSNTASNTFSSYDLLSCSRPNGCDGGLPYEAWGWIQKNGICTGTDNARNDGCKPYPFRPDEKNPILRGCSQSCTKSSWKPVYSIDRKHNVTSVDSSQGEAAIKYQLQTNGPVVAKIMAYEDLKNYNDGVYYYVKGEKKRATCDGKKIPFWIIRNSWSTSWGKSGFFYMRRGNNECDVEKYITHGIPTV